MLSKNTIISLQEMQRARQRLKNNIRQTPMIRASVFKEPLFQVHSKRKAKEEAEIYLKLELMQVTGSFKARGAVNKLRSLSAAEIKRGIITASGGNHGLGVAYAGWLAQTPTIIYLPENSPPAKAAKLKSWGAEVFYAGKVWDEANEAALKVSALKGLTYFHPFADPVVITGQATLGLEIMEEIPQLDTILVAIGGGGLISGVSLAAKALNPKIKIVGIEPVGAPTLYESIKAGKLVELKEITTLANTLAPRLSAQINLDIIRANVSGIILLTDEEMRAGARWLWFEMACAAELSGAAALAALLTGKYVPKPGEKVCALVCGAGTDGLL